MAVTFKSPQKCHWYSCISHRWKFPLYFHMSPFWWMAEARGIEGSAFPLCSTTAFRLNMGVSMNSRYSSGLYLMFIAVIRPSMFLQALSLPCVMDNCSRSFLTVVKCCHFQCHPEDFTVEVLKTTVLLYLSTLLGLWWGQKVLYVWHVSY
jgi:hypothetical protein